MNKDLIVFICVCTVCWQIGWICPNVASGDVMFRSMESQFLMVVDIRVTVYGSSTFLLAFHFHSLFYNLNRTFHHITLVGFIETWDWCRFSCMNFLFRNVRKIAKALGTRMKKKIWQKPQKSRDVNFKFVVTDEFTYTLYSFGYSVVLFDWNKKIAN